MGYAVLFAVNICGQKPNHQIIGDATNVNGRNDLRQKEKHGFLCDYVEGVGTALQHESYYMFKSCVSLCHSRRRLLMMIRH